MWAVLDFLKVPSNSISILAVLGAFGAPAVDKWLKSDEQRNAQISTLVTTTTELINVNDETLVQPTPEMLADPSIGAKLEVSRAKREILLNRATALARAIGDDAYPSVLFALSSQLCRDGRYEDGQAFMLRVLERESDSSLDRRPSNGDLAQAHVVSARCLGLLGIGGTLSPAQLADITNQMTLALKNYDKDGGIQAASEKANVYGEWAYLDQLLGRPEEANDHRKQAAVLFAIVDKKLPASSFTPRTPQAMPTPIKESIVNDVDLPTVQKSFTYKVAFAGRPDVLRVIVESTMNAPDWRQGGIVFRYEGGNFVQESETIDTTRVGGGFVWHFKTAIPAMVDNKPSRMATEWVIEELSAEHFEGVQQIAGFPPLRFTAGRLLPDTSK